MRSITCEIKDYDGREKDWHQDKGDDGGDLDDDVAEDDGDDCVKIDLHATFNIKRVKHIL